MTDEWRLDTLPSDVLLLIFEYCHAFDLVSLSKVCTRFNGIVQHNDVLWHERRNRPLATNQASRRFRDRCKDLLCLRRRWMVSENWQSGSWSRNVLAQWKVKSMPWIKLDKDILWCSNGNLLRGYCRRRNRRIARLIATVPELESVLRRDVNSDISKFVVRDDYLVAGHSDGSITFFRRDSVDDDCADLRIVNAHAANVNSVDEVPGAVISGSGDGTVKLWSQPRESGVAEPLSTIHVLDRVWSLAADPTGSMFAVGSTGNTDVPPFKLFDIECCSESIAMRHRWRRGAGILDIVWEDPNLVLTCGYDTTVRKWDTRIGSCVATWVDPTDSALYCISTDYRFTMVTGSQYNCKAVLWDQRVPTYVQMFFMNVDRKSKSSPVYGIAFDSSHLYGATDRRLVELAFSGRCRQQHDYRNIFRTEWSTPTAQNAIR